MIESETLKNLVFIPYGKRAFGRLFFVICAIALDEKDGNVYT